MSDVDQMYKHLVRTIRAGFPQYLSRPFEVGELYQTILPYRLHRRELGLETNSDYEHTLLELLSGANGYLVIEDRMRDVLAAERTSANPDPSRVREFSGERVQLAPEALALLDSGVVGSVASGSATQPRASTVLPPVRTSIPAPPLRASGLVTATAAPAESASDAGSRRATEPITIPEQGDDCSYCKGALPPGRKIAFCPHCGQDLTVVRCPACGSELERGWKFCVTCGRGMA